MISPETIAKVHEIYAEADALGYILEKTPPPERATAVRGLLLNHCIQLRAIMRTGTTQAAGIPLVEILRDTQRLMQDFRTLRKQRLH